MPESDRPIRIIPGLSPGTILFLIAWVLFSSAGPLLFAGDVTRTDLLDAGALHRTVFTVQVFVIIFLLPLLLSSRQFLNEHRSGHGTKAKQEKTGNGPSRTTDAVRAVRFLLFTLVVLLLGFPFVLIAGAIADPPSKTLIAGQLQVSGLVLGIGGIWWGAGQSDRSWLRHLFLTLVSLSLIVPVTYVSLVQIFDSEHSWLLLVSPVTVAAGMEGGGEVNPRLLQAFLCSATGILIGAGLYLARENGVEKGDDV